MTQHYTTISDLTDMELTPALEGEFDMETFDMSGFVAALKDRDLIVYVDGHFELVKDEDAGTTPGFYELADKFV